MASCMDFPLPVLSSRSDQISPSVWKAINFSLETSRRVTVA